MRTAVNTVGSVSIHLAKENRKPLIKWFDCGRKRLTNKKGRTISEVDGFM